MNTYLTHSYTVYGIRIKHTHAQSPRVVKTRWCPPICGGGIGTAILLGLGVPPVDLSLCWEPYLLQQLDSGGAGAGCWWMVSERTFDWLLTLSLADLLDLLAWLPHVIRGKLLNTELCYTDLRELLAPLARHPIRRVRQCDSSADSSNLNTSPEPEVWARVLPGPKSRVWITRTAVANFFWHLVFWHLAHCHSFVWYHIGVRVVLGPWPTREWINWLHPQLFPRKIMDFGQNMIRALSKVHLREAIDVHSTEHNNKAWYGTMAGWWLPKLSAKSNLQSWNLRMTAVSNLLMADSNAVKDTMQEPTSLVGTLVVCHHGNINVFLNGSRVSLSTYVA